MKIFWIKPGEPDQYVVMKGADGREEVYQLQTSERKMSAQLAKVSDLLKIVVLKAGRAK